MTVGPPGGAAEARATIDAAINGDLARAADTRARGTTTVSLAARHKSDTYRVRSATEEPHAQVSGTCTRCVRACMRAHSVVLPSRRSPRSCRSGPPAPVRFPPSSGPFLSPGSTVARHTEARVRVVLLFNLRSLPETCTGERRRGRAAGGDRVGRGDTWIWSSVTR